MPTNTFGQNTSQASGSPVPTGGAAGTPVIPSVPAAAPGVGAQEIQNATIAANQQNVGKSGYDVFGNPVQGANTTTPSSIAPPVQPQTEDQVYSQYVSQGQSIIDQINNAAASQINAANAQIDQGAATAQQNQNALASITGNFGSASVAGANAVAAKAGTDKNAADAQIQADAQNRVSTYLQNLQSAAQGQANYEQSTAFSQGQTYDTYLKGQATNTIQGLAKEGVTLQNLQTQAQSGNPLAQQTYQTLLQAYGGDSNALNAAAALATPTANVVQSWTQGSTLYQIVRNPQTNAVTTQSFDLGVTVPTGWVSNKVSTTTMIMQDPSNPANSIIYSTDPFTGQVTISGTGTGQTIAQQYNASNPQMNGTQPGTVPAGATGGAGTASTTISSNLGVDPTTPLSDVVSGVGIGALTQQIIANEGSSPQGVSNNPGNIKYTGAPGQTDSGVKATDGGTFASYKTPQDGEKAIGDLITAAASGQSSAYGQNPTLQDFVNKYTNTGQTDAETGSNGLPTAEYGSLANVAGFDPTGKNSTAPAGVDKAAFSYINTYLSGKQPTPASILGRSSSPGAFATVQQRADDVYYKATGQHLPNLTTLQGNLKLVNSNNALLNKLKVQQGTVEKNFGLSLQNLTANNINTAIPIINQLYDAYKAGVGDPATAQYFTQNQTLQNELSSLLSVKNAAGTTVQDKLDSKTLLPTDFSLDQQKAILNILIKEANNAQQGIGQANSDLYQQTDPLGLDPQNPQNQPGYQQFTSMGLTNNFDGTWTSPQDITLSDGTKIPAGTILDVDAQGNVETK